MLHNGYSTKHGTNMVDLKEKKMNVLPAGAVPPAY